MVSAAPTFEEIHIYLANILQDSIFVAHNISFDARFLTNEFKKVGVSVDFGQGICTLRKTSQKLAIACSSRNIMHNNAHRSLGDARATAELVKIYINDSEECTQIDFKEIAGESNPRTYRRDHFDANLAMPTTHSRRKIYFPTSNENEVAYLDTLDYLFEDSVLTSAEVESLIEISQELQISDWTRNFLNKQYINSFVVGAKRDGIFSQSEEKNVLHLVEALGIEEFDLPDFQPVKLTIPTDSIKICFTGEATFQKSIVPREKLEAIASLAGMTCVHSVTKKNCTLVVAADVHTMSGKAKKARDFEIPVISIHEFFSMPDIESIYKEILKKPDWF
jgi:DNA polymerase-3 subunit epsilon